MRHSTPAMSSCSSTCGATRRGDKVASAAPSIAAGTPVVVYCWSPGCNGGAKGAAAFARLGYDVKEMIGGYEYWVREGQPTENDDGELPRVFDPQVMVVRA